jgi:hypothetical protein
MFKRISRHLGVLSCIVVLCGIVGYRITELNLDKNREIYNIARIQAKSGIPVDYIMVKEKTDSLKYLLSVRNGRAFVLGVVAARLKVGMNVGKYKITFVSNSVDFDTGMFEVRISSKVSGEFYAMEPETGIFIPRSAAIGDDTVWVANNGVSEMRKIKIFGKDADKLLVKSGLKIGDLLIVSATSNLVDGIKVK